MSVALAAPPPAETTAPEVVGSPADPVPAVPPMFPRSPPPAAPTLLLAAAALVAAGPAATPAAAGLYTVRDLGTIAGADAVVASHLNDAGVATGYTRMTDGRSRATVFGPGGAYDLEAASGRVGGAGDINNANQVLFAGGLYDLDSGRFTPIAGAAEGVTGGAYLNDAGLVAGTTGTFFRDRRRGFLWSEAGGYRELPALADDQTFVSGLNAAGQVAGYAHTRDGTTAFRYDAATGEMTNLGRLAGDRGTFAQGLNDAGTVVGYARNANDDTVGFVTGPGDELIALDPLRAGGVSGALAVNDAGLIVGFGDVGGVRRAAVWDGGAVSDLNDLLVGGAGWVLEEARDVNAAGQIVGYGTLNGQTRGFLLTPAAVPEPATVSLLLAAAGLAAGVRRRRRR